MESTVSQTITDLIFSFQSLLYLPLSILDPKFNSPSICDYFFKEPFMRLCHSLRYCLEFVNFPHSWQLRVNVAY